MNTNLKLGQQLQVNIEKLVSGGEGLARLNPTLTGFTGFTVFVPYSCPEDKLQVQINEIKKNYARANIEQIIDSAKYRTNPPCPYFFNPVTQRGNRVQGSHSACGGC
ncbi:TRAM domain-containing protein, partial [Candidatus Gottesmanbacteria bacterium]|nr:TRAM domain-containing protein [Candidatus Gottesmanbacteria bacterium]